MTKEQLDLDKPQCQFFVVRKKRLCRMTVRPGRNYCGEHEPQPRNEEGQDDSRIPCPNDPKHTCYARKLEKHLAICNARKQETPEYIRDNVNAPPETDPPREPLSQTPLIKIKKLIDKVNNIYDKFIKNNIETLSERDIHAAVQDEWQTEGRTESSLRHLRQASRLMWIMEDESLVHDNTCYVELGAGKGHLSFFAWQAWCLPPSRSRVLLVERAALRHKRDNKIRDALLGTDKNGPSDKVTSNNVTSVDSVQNDDNNSKRDENSISPNNNIRSDRSQVSNSEQSCNLDEQNNVQMNVINKNSNFRDSLTEEEVQFVTNSGKKPNSEDLSFRLRADLAHLVLHLVPAVRECKAVVGFAKHLCGVATDYSLRCVTAAGVAGRVRGAVLATCCHHRCQRNAYVACAQLAEVGIDVEYFNIILGIVSWATCGDGRNRDKRMDPNPSTQDYRPTEEIIDTVLGAKSLGLSREEREEIGRRAKALLDWGRVLYMKQCGFDAKLAYYVPNTVSLENVCIIAKKDI